MLDAERERPEAVSFNAFSELENCKNEGVAMKFILQLSIFFITPYRPENFLEMIVCKEVCVSGFVLRMFIFSFGWVFSSMERELSKDKIS